MEEEVRRILGSAVSAPERLGDHATTLFGNNGVDLKGCPLSSLDGQIAAIARAHSFTLATRNEKDFDGCGIEVVNPFNAK